jgi:effector-binding domain-containing protein
VDYEIRVVQSQESPTAVVAATTTWEEFPALWPVLLDEVWAFLRSDEGSAVAKDGHNVMLYKDDFPSVEVGVQVDATFEPVGRVIPSVLPAGETAVAVHRGSPTTILSAYQAIAAWSKEAARPLAGLRWEIYGDWQEDESQFETEVRWLLA